jgi:drug/metabolite transporter (DMT)-like permease
LAEKTLSAREKQIAGDRPLFGILCLVTAGFVFSFFNAIVKHLSTNGMPVMEVAWGRYVFHLVFAIVYAGVARHVERPSSLGGSSATDWLKPADWLRPWRDMLLARKPGLQFLRSLLMLATTLLFFLAVSHIDLASATAVAFVEPMVITMLSPFLLKEKVGRRRWAAVAIGFIGVLIVIRPGFGMVSLAILLPVLSASTGATYNVLTRIAARYDSNATSLFYAASVGCLVLSCFMPFIWQAPSVKEWLLLAALGLSGGLAHTLVIRAFSYASASIIAPFIYLQLVWATAIGYVWFDMLPAATTWIGGAVIIATGIYTAHRERIRAKERAAALEEAGLSPKG